MKIYNITLLLVSLLLGLSSCEAIGTIFKAGMSWAFFLVFLVIAGIIWLLSRTKK